MSQGRSERGPRPPLARVDRPARALDAILGASPDLVFLCGPDGAVLDANHAAASAWGLGRADIPGKSWHDLGVPGDIAETFDAQRRKVLETSEAIVDEIRLPDGADPRVYEYSLNPVRGDGAEVTMVVFILRDITDRRR